MGKNTVFTIFTASSFILGACSPLAPSVSKLSNSTSTKSPTSEDSSTELNRSALITSKVVEPTVVTGSEYETIKTFQSKPHEELEKSDVEDLAINAKASFYANSNSVAGFEDDLIKYKVKVYLVVTSLSKSERSKLQETVKLTVSVDRTNKLTVSVVNTESNVKDRVLKHLTAATIEFENSAIASEN